VAAETLKLTILSPERRLVTEFEVDWVTLPGSEGQIQVLPGHTAMVGTLETGVFTYAAGGKEESGVISSGFFDASPNGLVVLADTLELKGEIDITRARKAQEKAEAALRESSLDEHHFKKYQLKLQRSLIRQHFAGH
jgi:F-type H+-transporting ATPase subunit epsilon